MRLTLKFTIAFLLALSAVLATYGWSVYRREAAQFQTDMRRDNQLIGRVVAAEIRKTWEIAGEAAALKLVEQANRSESTVRIRWIWPDAVADSPYRAAVPRTALEPLGRGEETAFIGRTKGTVEYLYKYVPVMVPDGRIGGLEVAESLEEQRQYTRKTIVRIALATGAIAALSALLALTLGGWFVARPMRSFADRMRRVAAGDLSGRLELHQHDELGGLATELNVMCDRLAEAQARVAAATEARIRTLEQLRHADRLRTVGQLTAGIAHELGTPLNVVGARAKMIAGGEVAGPEAAEYARIIGEQSARMTAMLRQLLEFARPRAPQKRLVDLSQVARRTLALLTPIATKRGIAIDSAGSETPIEVEADPDQLQQVLSNLVLNAIQAMPEGGQIEVGIRREQARPPANHGGPEDSYICLHVRDQGEGIAPQHLPHVFEPFFTTKGVGEGTGLGLSVSLGIIHEHGGWIDVESQVGQGSCFRVHLPQEPSQCADEH